MGRADVSLTIASEVHFKGGHSRPGKSLSLDAKVEDADSADELRQIMEEAVAQIVYPQTGLRTLTHIFKLFIGWTDEEKEANTPMRQVFRIKAVVSGYDDDGEYLEKEFEEEITRHI